MKLRNLLLLLFIYITGAGAASANEDPFCESFEPEPAQFKALYEQGKKLGRAICLSFGVKIEDGDLTDQFVEFAETASQLTAAAFANTDFADDMALQMQHFEELAETGIRKKNMPSFGTIPDQQSFGESVFFQFSNWDAQGKAKLEDPGCEQSGGASCAELFESLKIAIRQYKKPYQHLSGRDLSDRSQILMAQWDRYFEQARAQTLWDAVLTTAMEQDHLAQNRLVGPMKKQWFMIHPSIVIENVSAAADGEELSEALAIEWIGVNWWDADSSPIGYPFGISLASVYSDRAEIEEVGHGLMFHFGNSISIGWTDHDGDEGISVTVDFLSMMAKKKQRWETFKKEIDSIVENEKQQVLNQVD